MPYYIDDNQVTLGDLMNRLRASDLVPSRLALLDNLEAHFEMLKGCSVHTLSDLRKAVKTSKSIAALSMKTNIDIEYLTLLRREVESYFPKAYKLSEFDWLDLRPISILEKQGFTDTAKLFEASENPSKLEEIIAFMGLESDFPEEILALVDLSRIQWVSPTFARVLFLAGYPNAKEVAAANAKALYADIDRTNHEGRYYKGKVGIRDMERLIQAAGYVG